MTAFRLGRLPRAFDPRVPHLSSLVAGRPVAPPPPSCDWTKGMPSDLGMMLNDRLGDCTCAAVYHAFQVWTLNAGGVMRTQPDVDVERLYELACGYEPRQPGEGPGGVEQTVLTYLLREGAPVGPYGAVRQKIAAFVEVDPRNLDDVKRTIFDCGVAYIGFPVPQYIAPIPPATPPAVWDVGRHDDAIVGGHAVVLAGYDDLGASLISWGRLYRMTWRFFARYVDEVYAIADAQWVEAKGSTPGGLSLAALEVQMRALSKR